MFHDLTDGPLQYDPPWDQQPLEARLATVRGGCPRVAWLYERPDTSTFRYRCLNPSATLNAAHPGIGAAWFEREDIPLLTRGVSNLDALIICRYRYDGEVARLITRARASGTRVLFDCDDLIFDTRHVHLVLDTTDYPTDAALHWDSWFAYIGRIGATALLCDGGITTNGFLAERLAGVMGKVPIGILPNYFASDQEVVSRQLLDAKRKKEFRSDGRITVGYFSGSPSHNKDFAIAAPALARLMATDLDVDLRIVGFPPANGILEPFAEQIEVIPLQDHLNLQRVIAEVEVNIAPLQDNLFTNCKSELKFFEAAAVGTWTIATPTFTFRRAIRDGVTGRLARAHEWDAALAEAISLVRDPVRYAPIAEAAAAAAYSGYGWDRQAERILDAVGLS